MLPKLLSNIILAVIAIVVLYTLAPLIKEFLNSFTGKKSKKSMSKNDFDEMVRRKSEQLASGATPSRSQAAGPTKSTSTRSEWDYLVEKGYFESDEDRESIQKLKKALEWGVDPSIEKIQKSYLKLTGVKEISPDFNSILNLCLTKNKVLENFPKKEITYDKFVDKFLVELYFKELQSSPTPIIDALSKKLRLSSLAVFAIIKITILNKSEDKSLSALDLFIEGEEVTLSEKLLLTANEDSLKDLIIKIKKNIDIIIPLQALKEKEIKNKIFSNEKDKTLLKKTYKKVIAQFHPDRWTFFSKSELVDKRLRENFNLVQKTYDTMMED